MRSSRLGVVLPMGEHGRTARPPRWVDIRELAFRAEAMGFDTVWIADELLWRPADRPVQQDGGSALR